ncbi:MAG TPA: hypothetical protein VFR85_20175 [Anaeromyxobacteraceae bacterium]|nr:hypothetical protein [Anaeromyxobacteraceae bacterium]
MSSIDPIHVAPSAQRQTEPSGFGEVMRAAGKGLVDGVALTASLAAPFVPGGPILAGAVREGVRAATSPRSAAGGSGDVVEATRALQQEAQSFNLQYLQLQETMQRESREFQALSNVMKVKHDSAKAAINNIH